MLRSARRSWAGVRARRPTHFTEYKDFVTPELDLDELVWPRNEPGTRVRPPARRDHRLPRRGGRASQARRQRAPAARARAERRVQRRSVRASSPRPTRDWPTCSTPSRCGSRSTRRSVATCSTAGRRSPTCTGRVRRIRAFPPRLMHVLAGNAPGVTGDHASPDGALTKGVHLLKLPSNDLLHRHRDPAHDGRSSTPTTR